ncbi:hypothetical protein L4C36_10680 [Photobacterium japonica]|uniref:hypothetical protein n=1 Tax=Photobacterium japonica TaxID=2910235 RepID=UPI003D11F114
MKKWMWVLPLCGVLSLPAVAGCFMGETDDSEWIEHTITFSSPLKLDYNTRNWDDIHHFQFDFGYEEILNPRSFRVEAELVSPITEKQSISGRLKGSNSANGSSLNPGQGFYMNLNDKQYFDRLAEGRIHLGLARTGSDEVLYLKNITARFCGEPVVVGEKVFVEANKHAMGNGWGEMLTQAVDADVTYSLTVLGSAADGDNQAFDGVNVDYVDPRSRTRHVQSIVEGKETFVHTDGHVRFFYVTDTQENIGGHTVVLKRVNLD